MEPLYRQFAYVRGLVGFDYMPLQARLVGYVVLPIGDFFLRGKILLCLRLKSVAFARFLG